MSEMKKAFKWWWPWQPEKIEDFLESMAAQGWSLAAVRSSATRFVFEKREPRKVRFCVDYQGKDTAQYRTLLADAGWRFEYTSSGWFIWSMAYEGERPVLYTDTASLLMRNQTILRSLTAVFAAQIPLMVAPLIGNGNKGPVLIGVYAIWSILCAVMLGVILGMVVGINKLKKKNMRN